MWGFCRREGSGTYPCIVLKANLMKIVPTREEARADLRRIGSRVGTIVVTLFAVALGRALFDWLQSPSTQSTNSDTDTWISGNIIFMFFIALFWGLMFFLRRSALANHHPPKFMASAFSRLFVKAPSSLRLLITLVILSLIAGELLDARSLAHVMIHTSVCVASAITIYVIERKRQLLWLCILGLMIIIYFPAAHVITMKSDWVIVNRASVIILIFLSMLIVDAPISSESRAQS
jgi:hypothetical protein